MPELPEVEVVRRGLAAHVLGRVITRVDVGHERAIRRHVAGAADFAGLLENTSLTAALRRGKYLWLPLDDGVHALLGHLGMSGQLLVQPAAVPDEPHLRVRVVFADGDPELRFVDQRTFGGLAVVTIGADGVPVPIAHIAPDPLDPLFDDEAFRQSLRRRRTGVKRALLDQSLVSGVGNIYADEALWRARLHYARATETLRRPDVARLLAAVREVMGEALRHGGTSFDSLYVDVNGDSGYFDRSLNVYGRAGQPCRRCATPIRRDPFMNRSSYTCPTCQPRPRHGRW
ncbi:bifunctional DNA-formamidopyrimidine glycosylase/DNA-(apurinic or apyrimidinic site) lyase [Jiangella asiatica]|uniref:Formamidopyrimidine-DNA glycosylase n=1 Tax=Jiangella asiatica TaxID=2530372 RepID=A0A4R5CKR7_9ACTN|nr:bifunctional DNA-formamidopyrimidine glycosylase/DNA-(apurinic or apyrimidinic site) lyase [Jiangella asiatica]TDD98973.1 bifunctional DNA-formamidopyrimidine glycosylase/DNA-(apurinic or apyrimidinic site) lyase [Jiangella asiatica]